MNLKKFQEDTGRVGERERNARTCWFSELCVARARVCYWLAGRLRRYESSPGGAPVTPSHRWAPRPHRRLTVTETGTIQVRRCWKWPQTLQKHVIPMGLFRCPVLCILSLIQGVRGHTNLQEQMNSDISVKLPFIFIFGWPDLEKACRLKLKGVWDVSMNMQYDGQSKWKKCTGKGLMERNKILAADIYYFPLKKTGWLY